MTVKFIIFVLIYNLNLDTCFPIENFSIDYNGIKANDVEKLATNSNSDDSQPDVNFELIHESDENKKIIKKRDTKEPENSAENHINHKEHSFHHSNGFSYQRPTNIPRESAESHRYVTKTAFKQTTRDKTFSNENTSQSNFLSTSDTEVLVSSARTADHNIKGDHTTESVYETVNKETTDNFNTSEKDLNTSKNTTANIDEDLNKNVHNYTEDIEASTKHQESNHDCDGSVENMSKNSTKKSYKLNQSTEHSSNQTISQNLTTSKKKSDKDINKQHNPSTNHISGQTSFYSSEILSKTKKTSTKSSKKSSSTKYTTMTSIDPVLHKSTSLIPTTEHNIHNNTKHHVNSTKKSTKNSSSSKIHPNTTADPKSIEKSIKTKTTCRESSHEENLNATLASKNHKNDSIHGHAKTTSKSNNHTESSKNYHSNSKIPSFSTTHHPSNHKIIHSQDTTRFEEWTIADKTINVESHEDNKLGHNHKKSTTQHLDHDKSSTTHQTSTNLHHEFNNQVHDKPESTTEHTRVRFAIPRVAQKQSQGFKNEENSKFDHNHLDDDVEVFKITEKSMTEGIKGHTSRHSFKFVG